jgi:uncharacterized membrane protein
MFSRARRMPPSATVVEAAVPLAVFHLPRVGSLVRRAIPGVLEAMVAPTLAFYLGLWLWGPWGGLGAALAWSYGMLARRLIGHDETGGLLMLAVISLSVRAVVTGISGSFNFYFLQPIVAEALLGVAFLVSLVAGRSLAHRLAGDFVALDGLGHAQPLRRVFAWITVLWAVVFLFEASLGWWLLSNHSMEAYVAYRAGIGAGLKGLAVVGSALWFRLGMRRRGVRVSFG